MYPPVGEAGGASLPGCDYRLIDESMVVYVECALSSQRITGSLQFRSRSPRCKKEPPPRAARIRARGEHRTGAALRLEPLDYSDLSVVPRAVGARGLHPTRGAGREYGGPALYSLGVLYVFGSGFINNYFRDSHDGGVGILCRARRFVTDLLSSSGVSEPTRAWRTNSIRQGSRRRARITYAVHFDRNAARPRFTLACQAARFLDRPFLPLKCTQGT